MSGHPDLRLIVITDRGLARPRDVMTVVQAALDAGAPAIQLRDKLATAAELLRQARALLPLTRAAGALLFINDRLDVALAAGADGVHLGPDDLPVAAARRIAPRGFLVGCSTDDPDAARRAEADGADYIGCGAVFGTRTKTEVGAERIGVRRLDEVAAAVDIPVIGIGGITAGNVAEVAATRAAGAAAVGEIMAASDPAAAVTALLTPWSRAAG
ncbi:MAG TPA: thiamine phosphate synthase [Longimicrobiales bacterium]|nr:thiamine phosphate synthase [Longimicrobiales bacterium]